MSESMRAQLEKAFEQHIGDEADPPGPVGDESLAAEASPGGGEPETPVEAPKGDTPPEATDEPGKTEEKVDLKFLPPEDEAERPEVSEPVEKAPVSWKGEAKGHWGELPPPVRQEVLRREKEVNQVLRDTTDAREFGQQFQQVVSPFMGFIEAEQSTPLQAVQNLMRTAAVFRVGTPQQKAAVAADIIKQFGVDVGMLDSVLVGQQPAPADNQANQVMQYLEKRLAPVEALATRFQTAQTNAAKRQDNELSKELEEFTNSGDAEFFEDVREDMADLLDLAHRRGQKMNYKQAYEKALGMNPELSAAVARKKEIAKNQASIEKKKRASASVQGIPPGSNGATPPGDLRGQLEAAWEAQEGGAR